MNGFAFWRTAAKLAWRDMAGGPRVAVLTASAVAVSVAATSAVWGIGAALETSLRGDLRTWLGGDISVFTLDAPNHEQASLLETLARNGIESTLVITAPANAMSGNIPEPSSLLVKFVDPVQYPLYGQVSLENANRLRATLNAQTAILSESAIERLGVRIGDQIRLSGALFRVAAVARSEPDLLAGTPPLLGPHAILSLGALPRTSIGRTAFLHYRILFRMGSGQSVAQIRHQIEGAFPEAEVLDYREPTEQASDILETALLFVRATAWLAVIFGAAAASISIRMHLYRKRDFITIMRILGARRPQILAVSLFQAGLIASAGTAVGIVAATLVEWRVSVSLSRLIPLANAWIFEPGAILSGAGLALAVVACTVIPQVFSVTRVKPAVAERWTSHAGSRSLVVALASGILVIVFVAAGRHALVYEIPRQLPLPDSGVVIPGILPALEADVADFLQHQPGVQGQVRSLTMAWFRLTAIDGRPISGRRLNQMWLAACEPDNPEIGFAGPRDSLSIDEEIANRLGAGVGSRLQFRAGGEIVNARVTTRLRMHPVERIWRGLLFDCSVLARMNTAHHIYARVDGARLEHVIGALHARFPALPVDRARDLFAYVGDATRSGVEVIETMSVLVAVAGALLLISVIAAWQWSFRREVAIYKVLGARRRRLIMMISRRLSLAGLLAACIGVPLGCAASSIILSLLLERRIIAVPWLVFVASIPAAIALSNIGGWMISFGLLNAKPLDVLSQRD